MAVQLLRRAHRQTSKAAAPRAGRDKVIFVPFRDGAPAGPPIDVLMDFLDSEGNARGRPVGVAIDKNGGLLVADDVGNAG